MILALETSCDDTCAAVVDGARVRSNVISSQAAAHERFGGVVPEVASRHHLELVNPVVDAALADAGAELEELDALAVTRGPGLIGALLVGVSTAKALAAARASRWPASIICTGTSPPTSSSPTRSSRRSSAWSRAAGTRCSPGSAIEGRTRSSARRSTTPPARRSTRARGCSASAIPAGRRSSARRPRAIPRRSSSRSRCATTRGSTSASAASRPRCSTGSASWARRRRTSGAPTSRRASRRRSSASSPPGSSARSTAGDGAPWRSAAASPPTGCCARGRRRSARRGMSA